MATSSFDKEFIVTDPDLIEKFLDLMDEDIQMEGNVISDNVNPIPESIFERVKTIIQKASTAKENNFERT